MRRRLVLALIGIAGGAVVSLAVFAYVVGPEATRRAISGTALRAESAVWPVLSRVTRWITPGPDREEREVWRVLIEGYSRGPRGRVIPIAIAPRSEWSEDWPPDQVQRWIVEDRGANDGSHDASVAVQNMLFLNTHRASLESVPLSRGSKFLTREAMFRHAQERLGWEIDSGANGVDGYLALSRPGFNMRGDVAVIYADFMCGPMCGHGTYYVLRKKNGKWVIGEDHWRWAA